ncbi:MAG: aldo/keto reductase [Oscillospiraceae bacterium]|jgi:L-glyceraldehyde 3-phosphate reductase|nr:aldo/keto reductase [Oscillospiraceae bacterium]
MSYCAARNRYEQTVYRRVGQSGLHLPAISLGLWQNFGSVNDFENSRSMLLRAFDLGITHFDLANNYGPDPGTAEQTLGRVLESDLRPYRDELVISTKAGYTMWPGPYGDFGSRKYLLASLDQSLRRMKLDYVDIFYSHRFDPDTPLEETMGALETAVRSGKALYVGISNYNTEQTVKAVEILRGLGVRCLIHQPRYNMLDRHAESDGLFDTLNKLGMGSIVYSPLAQGLLTTRYLNGIPAGSRADRNSFLSKKDITEQLIAKICNLTKIASDRGQTLAQMALAWVLRKGFATSALIGASSVAQLEENLGAVKNIDFTDQELNLIEKVLEK